MPMAAPIQTSDAPGHRPNMRRKSSAQNLLSSFKSTPQVGSVSSATGLQFVPVPTPPPNAASMGRDWDVQSQQSESVAPSTLSSGTNGAPAVQGTSVEILRELVRKRIITLTYLRNVHEGRSHWFHTIMVTRGELERAFPNTAMKARTYRLAMLGMGLAHLFDIKDPQDLLRGFSNVLNEYDAMKDPPKEDGDRLRMACPF
ncbi:uncharacterized protein FIBRA_07231 [Fibroporia radiculosa]|uniref:Uncharacterized protein n=1 Tax=Fibroporia radiculosa TaxID=599839 RepID=J4IBP7_9APHY|nr:uncharacterized protein FIBRA_07231 [Fibroporia radiculosa]CCM05031.1 predicted protein [Fibroporia radiculosa]